jgi:outer membrane protein W
MKPLLLTLGVIAFALPAAAQVEIFFDAEGVRRSGQTSEFTPGVTRFEPEFRTGGGVGGGLNIFVSDRVSIEAKIAALATKTRVRIVGSDFVAVADLGWAQLYPISAVLQWHLLERGAFRPYLGVGVVHTVLRNINKQVGVGATGIRFKDPTGAVVDAGLELSLARKWSLLGDARYVPMETNSTVTFPGTVSALKMHVRPLIVSFGAGYKW